MRNNLRHCPDRYPTSLIDRSRAPPPLCALGHAFKGPDGKLHFRGLVATTDGKEMMETSRVAPFTEADALKVGQEAGAELKAKARPGFFMW